MKVSKVIKSISCIGLAIILIAFNFSNLDASSDFVGDDEIVDKFEELIINIKSFEELYNIDIDEHVYEKSLIHPEKDSYDLLPETIQETIDELIAIELESIEKDSLILENNGLSENLNFNHTNSNSNDNVYIDGPSEKTASHIVTIYRNNLKTADAIKNHHSALSLLSRVTADAYRAGMFASLVKTGGPWDLKIQLGVHSNYYFRGEFRDGEYIGNHHYGFMGRAVGYYAVTLKSAAGLYQVISDNWKIENFNKYFDQPEDTKAIQDGINMYNSDYRF